MSSPKVFSRGERVLMSEERLAEIEARAEAATPGPWVSFSEHDHQRGQPDPPLVGATISMASRMIAKVNGRHRYENLEFWKDAEFIAHAREDVPELLAEVRELRRLLDML